MTGEHLLQGRVWDVKNYDFIAPETLVAKLKPARFILLGEIHTNFEHHLKQAEIINNISDFERHPAICFEMLEVTCQEKIDEYLNRSPHDAEGFGNAIDWDSQWNPAYEMYKPIFETAFSKNLPVVAANIPRTLAKQAVIEGLKALSPEFIKQTGISQPFPPELQKELIDEIWESHFGQTKHSRGQLLGLLEGMALAQKLRDAIMAYTLLHNQRSEKQVLITGNGHVRNDRGVPYHLVKFGAKAGLICSLGMIETEWMPEYPALPEYQEWLKVQKLPYTFAIFIPGHTQSL